MGFITRPFIKLIRGKAHEVHGMMWGTAIAFVIYFALPWLRMVVGF